MVILVAAMPARFYTVRIIPKNGPPRELTTGSGPACAAWAIETARLVAAGLVSL